jgi:uncharacterized membrane protein
MTRQEFLTKLRGGLAGMPATAIADIVSDYETHFADGQAAGRSEQEVASALGDPTRLARELRAEQGLKAWQETRTPSTAVTAVFAVLGLGALDFLFLFPILIGVASALLGLYIAEIVGVVIGGAMMVGGPFFDGGGGAASALILAGLGVIAISVSLGALTLLATIWLINGLVWYGRLHFRLLKPAIDS